MIPGSALVMVVYCLVVLRTRLSRRRLEDCLHILRDFLNSKKSVRMDCSFQVMVAICGTHTAGMIAVSASLSEARMFCRFVDMLLQCWREQRMKNYNATYSS